MIILSVVILDKSDTETIISSYTKEYLVGLKRPIEFYGQCAHMLVIHYIEYSISLSDPNASTTSVKRKTNSKLRSHTQWKFK